jgi:hypothetical protein
MQDAVEVARSICHDQGIDLDDPEVTFRILVTEIDWQTGVVISATNLPRLASFSPEDRSWFPPSQWLKTLLEEHQYIILPAWLVDLQGAICGDRASASRFLGRINPRRITRLLPPAMFSQKAQELGISSTEAQLELMTDVLLQVLIHQHEALPIWSASNPVSLRHPDGNTEAAVPNQFDPWTFRQWAEFQTIRGTRDRLDELPVHVDILINMSDVEGEPSQLWWYPDLPPANRGGRPPRDSFGGTPEGLIARVGPAIVHLNAKGKNPTMAAVAELIDLSVDTLTRAIQHYKFPDWEAVVIRANNEFGQG